MAEVMSFIQSTFAVNSDIYEEVSQKAHDLGLHTHILSLHATQKDIRESLNAAVDHVGVAPLHHFFGELLGSGVTAAALNAAANALSRIQGCQGGGRGIEDTVYSTIVSAGALLAAHATDALAVHALMFAGLEKAAIILSGPIGCDRCLHGGHGSPWATPAGRRSTARRATSRCRQWSSSRADRSCRGGVIPYFHSNTLKGSIEDGKKAERRSGECARRSCSGEGSCE